MAAVAACVACTAGTGISPTKLAISAVREHVDGLSAGRHRPEHGLPTLRARGSVARVASCFDGKQLDIFTRAVVVVVWVATVAVCGRGIYALVHTDKLSDWITVALLLGIPAGWAYVATVVNEKRL
ncbi:hypothetical protein VSS74_14195 [Conexibacter stalactiti]|uniref:Uncharacterized protein n=1 Tax=Conexibacter stalactiti TaxID=1940611 RepID=A0ABU4HQD7_9ACTN|nr:hypothetical protein [Conexibacter stalactiti]MDW5595496.1 hypothetical protein [Conexibacter stalactiti]MEC5036138.1 hypothetical protein [Conexibacter stalactiti]